MMLASRYHSIYPSEALKNLQRVERAFQYFSFGFTTLSWTENGSVSVTIPTKLITLTKVKSDTLNVNIRIILSSQVHCYQNHRLNHCIPYLVFVWIFAIDRDTHVGNLSSALSKNTYYIVTPFKKAFLSGVSLTFSNSIVVHSFSSLL